MEPVLFFLVALPLAAAGVLVLVDRSGDFKKLIRTLIFSGIVCGITAAFLAFSVATVPIAPYETGGGAWTPVILGVALAFLSGFGSGVLAAAAIGIPFVMIRHRKKKYQLPSTDPDQAADR